MSHRWAQSRRLDLTSHLRSIAGTIVEHEEAEKIFLANALGENGVLNAWAKPQAITPYGLQGLVGCPAGSADPGATGCTRMRLGQRPQPTAIGDHVPDIRALGGHPTQQGIQVCPAWLPPPMVIDQGP